MIMIGNRSRHRDGDVAGIFSLVAVIVLACLIVITYGRGGWLARMGHDVLLAALICVAVVLPHELGHLAGGKLAGMRFGALWVMGVGLTRRRTGWALTLSFKNWHTGGSCLMYPVNADGLVRRYLIDLAGGPILGLVAVAVYAALPLFLLVPPASDIALLLRASVAMGLVLNLGSLWPDWPGPSRSDAYHIRALLRGGHMADNAAAMMTVARLDWVGYRYEEMDDRLLADLTKLEPLSRGAAASIAISACHAYYWNLSLGRHAAGHEFLDPWESALRSLNKPLAALCLERAYFAAYFGYDIKAAERYFAMVPATIRLPALRARAEAAIALGRAQPDTAKQAAELGLRLADALERSEWNLSRLVLRDLRALKASADEAGPASTQAGSIHITEFSAMRTCQAIGSSAGQYQLLCIWV